MEKEKYTILTVIYYLKEIIYNRKGKEYNSYGNLEFEGKYLNGKN